MNKLMALGIFLLLSISSIWSMEQGSKRKYSDSENQSESDQITRKKAKTDNEDDHESLCYLNLLPDEILFLIIENALENDIKSSVANKALDAYKHYNRLRLVNTAFRRILPAIPLSMNYVPLIRKLFLEAAKTGNVHMLQFLCNNGFGSIKQVLSKPMSWVNQQEENSSITIEKFLPRGFSLNQKSYEDWLITAIGYGNIEFCKILIQNGLFEEVQNAALIYAIILQNVEQVKRLIETGNGQGMLFGKYTETMIAAACGNIEIFKLFSLTERNFTIVGSRPGDLGYIYSTSLRCAARNGHIEIVKILLEIKNNYGKLDVVYSDLDDQTHALTGAAGENQLEMVEFLLSINPNSLNDHASDVNMTALGAACKNGHQKMVKSLLKKGAKINVYLGKGEKRSPLRLACRSGDIRIVRKLLRNFAYINQCSEWPILMIPIFKGDLPIAQLLMEYGADVNATGIDGSTPLIQAVIMGYIELVKWLVSNHVKINYIDEDGFTATDHARQRGKEEILNFLLMHGGIETDKTRLIN